jgi:hypothetical protein
MALVQRVSVPQAPLVMVSQPGGARYGGGCNPDATRLLPGCNGAKVLQPGCSAPPVLAPEGVAAGTKPRTGLIRITQPRGFALTSAGAGPKGKMPGDRRRTGEARSWPGICLRSGTDSE